MTRSEFNARQLTLESRIFNASYHADRNGRFTKAWKQLYHRSGEQLQALIDERDEYLRDIEIDRQIEESMGK